MCGLGPNVTSARAAGSFPALTNLRGRAGPRFLQTFFKEHAMLTTGTNSGWAINREWNSDAESSIANFSLLNSMCISGAICDGRYGNQEVLCVESHGA